MTVVSFCGHGFLETIWAEWVQGDSLDLLEHPVKWHFRAQGGNVRATFATAPYLEECNRRLASFEQSPNGKPRIALKDFASREIATVLSQQRRDRLEKLFVSAPGQRKSNLSFGKEHADA